MLNDTEASPTVEKNFHFKGRQWFPISGVLTHFAYRSPFSSNWRKIDLIAAEMPLVDKIFSFETQTSTSCFVVC
jgi:hypothetical protein